MSLELSPRQRATVAAAVTLVGAVVLAAAMVLAAIYIGRFFRHFSSVFLPLAVAGLLALVFKPYYVWLKARRLPAVAAVAAVFVSLLLPVVALSWFFGALVVGQLVDLVQGAPAMWDLLVAEAQERWPQVQAFWSDHPWGQRLKEALEARQEDLVSGLSSMSGRALSVGVNLLGAIFGLLGWAVLPVYFGYFLMVEPKLPEGRSLFPFLKEATRKDALYLIGEFVEIMVAFFRGQLLIGLLQGMLFALGFSIVGLRYGLVLGLVLGFLNVIPYLGSIVGLAVALPLAFWQQDGGLRTVIAVLVVFTIVQMIEGYFLTPRIMGNQTGLHPIAIILAVFFWGSALGGITGMILAIPLTAFLASFWRLARDKYIAELV